MNSKRSRFSWFQDWNNRRKQKNKKKEEQKKQDLEAKEPKDVLEEKIDDNLEPVFEENKEFIADSVSEESDKIFEETDEKIIKPADDGTGEIVPESIVEESEEIIQEPITGETKEDIPKTSVQEPKQKARRIGRLRGRSWFGKLKLRKKEKESVSEPEWIKFLTFGITLVAMLLGLSIMPLFPQPLPAVLAFLIAFVTYKSPLLGMPIGGLLVGLGLMYNLAKLNFIVMLGTSDIRLWVVFLFLFLFTGLPIVFRDRKSAIVINLGIIAAISLFFGQAYFLAIPVIFSSIVIFKKISFLSIIYYLMLSFPLQVLQYLKHVNQIIRVDWWVEPGSSPPLFVPLTEIFTDVQESMLQFRLYDTSKVVFAISEQLEMDPPLVEHTVLEMFSHYLDSLPGIILFLVMIIGIVSAVVLLVRTTFSQTNLGELEKILPIIIATGGTILFYVLANSLQDPLAFRVDLTSSAMAFGTIAAVIFTIPTFFMDQAPKEHATIDMIKKKTQELLERLLIFEDSIRISKVLPISFSSLEIKSEISKDKLEDINRKNMKNLISPSEIDGILEELNKLEKTIDNLDLELNDLLVEYQIFSSCEQSKWIGQFENIGLKIENKRIVQFEKGLPLVKRVESLCKILENNRILAEEIIAVSEQIYAGIRLLFDPNLPNNNQSMIFVREKLKENLAPWNVFDTLYAFLINMKKNYKYQIYASVENLERSLKLLTSFIRNSERSSLALGEDYKKLSIYLEKVDDFEFYLDKNNLSVFDVILIKRTFDSIIDVTKGIFSILFENLITKEKTIEKLMPPEGYMWGKNIEIKDKMVSAIKLFKSKSKLKASQVLGNLPSIVSLSQACIDLLISYNEKQEILLNYPIAEIIVEDQLKKNNMVTIGDLPFDPKYSQEYLKLFHSKRYNESSFDKTNNILRSK